MKCELMEYYHIPSEATIIDPHGRHTTTNIRNAFQMLYRYEMPFSAVSAMLALVVIVILQAQIDGVVSPTSAQNSR